MSCTEIRDLFSPYLDRQASGAQMLAVESHLKSCGPCRAHHAQLAGTQRLVAALGPKKAPADLTLRLHVTISQARSQSYQRRWEALQLRWSHAVNVFMFPATAGLVSAVFFFGLMIGFFAIPLNVEASSKDDTPAMLYTPPQLNSSPFITTVGSMDGSLVVETYVDSNGRVADYRVLSAPAGTERLRHDLDNMMIFTTFRPAMNLGRPTASRVVLSFSGVSVKG
jgi:hypothetical protein